jgi:hypothetical protein
MAKTEIIYPENVGAQVTMDFTWQLKKLKFWEPFWSYKLNSTAHLAKF